MKVKLKKGILNGEYTAIPSKSYAHRYIISSLLSFNKCEIDNIYLSEDIKATLNCIREFGFNYEVIDTKVIIYKEKEFNKNPIFDCNESGSTLRFLIPVALALFDHSTFVGSDRLMQRGLQVYEDICKEQNIEIIRKNNSISFKGKLQSGCFKIRGDLSSQYITGLLFALPLLEDDSVIEILPPIESKSYIDITMEVLSKFNINFTIEKNKIFVKGKQKYIPGNNCVEGDYSNAAFFEAFNYLGSNIKINGLNESSNQGDKIYQSYFKVLNENNALIDISNCIDLGPVLFAFAALKNGGTFIGTQRLKIKESNRAVAMQTELEKMNIKVDVKENEVIVYKSNIDYPLYSFDSHNDHRIAMALSLFASLFDIEIKNAEAVNKSYPNYFEELKRLGIEVFYDR